MWTKIYLQRSSPKHLYKGKKKLATKCPAVGYGLRNNREFIGRCTVQPLGMLYLFIWRIFHFILLSKNIIKTLCVP